MEKTRISVTIETDEIWVIKRPRYFMRGWCECCEREVSLVTPPEAARLVCCDLETIDFFVQNNRLHVQFFRELTSFICLNSLCSI